TSIFPLSFTITQLFNFLFGLIVIAIFLLFFGVMPGWQIVYLPILIIVTLVFLLAISLVLGYFTVFVRDIDNLLSNVIYVVIYASPMIWLGGLMPDEYRWAVDYNLIAIIVGSYRYILMYQQSPDFIGLAAIFVLSIIATIFIMNYYRKQEHKIIKAL